MSFAEPDIRRNLRPDIRVYREGCRCKGCNFFHCPFRQLIDRDRPRRSVSCDTSNECMRVARGAARLELPHLRVRGHEMARPAGRAVSACISFYSDPVGSTLIHDNHFASREDTSNFPPKLAVKAGAIWRDGQPRQPDLDGSDAGFLIRGGAYRCLASALAHSDVTLRRARRLDRHSFCDSIPYRLKAWGLQIPYRGTLK